MSNNISNYFSQAASTTPAAVAKPNASGSSTSSTDPTGLNSVFLNLLTQELQNQDPTAPMDSTAMVGQMISLNQLNELYSIQQTLAGSGANSTSSATKSAQTQTATQAANAALAAMASPAAGSMTSSFPSFTPATQTTAVNPYSFASQSHAASTMPLALR
ncbi:MAG TPA: flagellar hook capping FlgD N-terminal domain-containing protein [Acidobacteriaceae bacterium]|jgi:flagellar basal-body rod modification protein FlgD